MLPHLFICLTPLQALIAEQLICENAPRPAHLLMLSYYGENHQKFFYYFQQISKLCEYSQSCIIQNTSLKRVWQSHQILHQYAKHYHTIFAANMNNFTVQYFASHIAFERFETFDDGTASIVRKIMRRLLGIRYETDDLRQLSHRHHTLYPNLPNIVAPTVALNLWREQGTLPPTQFVRKILLGQPVFPTDDENIALFQKLIEKIQPDAYFPHPREAFRLPEIEYIHTPLIFEDFLLKEIARLPETEFHIYHLASTAALNVANFAHVKTIALRPDSSVLDLPLFNSLYALMQKMGMEIQSV